MARWLDAVGFGPQYLRGEALVQGVPCTVPRRSERTLKGP